MAERLDEAHRPTASDRGLQRASRVAAASQRRGAAFLTDLNIKSEGKQLYPHYAHERRLRVEDDAWSDRQERAWEGLVATGTRTVRRSRSTTVVLDRTSDRTKVHKLLFC